MNRDILISEIALRREKSIALSDAIFDNPETGRREFYAGERLTALLEDEGFCVERGIGGIDSAFRAKWSNGRSGPRIGLLCEYDALAGFGHGCGHHMQGPAIAVAAAALKSAAGENPFSIVVYGTPDEEYGNGKITMISNGCFKDIDFALMTHAGPNTTVDVKSLAQKDYIVEFYGTAAHAAIKPEAGRSAVDAMMLAIHGFELLREHVRDDVRLHYLIIEAGTAANIVPDYAKAMFTLRSYSSGYLETVCARFERVIQGAALMTETEASLKLEMDCKSKIPSLSLNRRMMQYAAELNAPQQLPFREKTGSTDFGNVLHVIPGGCIRVAFVPEGTSSHSIEWLKAGKSDMLHDAIALSAQILALTCRDLICDEAFCHEVKAEHEAALKQEYTVG